MAMATNRVRNGRSGVCRSTTRFLSGGLTSGQKIVCGCRRESRCCGQQVGRRPARRGADNKPNRCAHWPANEVTASARSLGWLAPLIERRNQRHHEGVRTAAKKQRGGEESGG